jgi:hypothetical protein
MSSFVQNAAVDKTSRESNMSHSGGPAAIIYSEQSHAVFGLAKLEPF